MDKRSLAEQFYIDDHALIYGLLGKYAEECCGEKGMDTESIRSLRNKMKNADKEIRPID